MFDPTYPPTNALIESAPLRTQFNGLKDLIDAVPTISAVQMDTTLTLPPGSLAVVGLSVTGGTLHFTFGIPQGNDGAAGTNGTDGGPGPQGPAGNDGAPGAPFTNFVVDNVNPLPPGSIPTVAVSFDGTAVRMNFGIPQGIEGPQGIPGPQGPPFANALVDGVTPLNPGDNATVQTSFDGSNVRFQFGIPRGQNGNDGGTGPQGQPGEVTNAQLSSAINGTSANSNGVANLNFASGTDYDPVQQQHLIDKLNELINTLRR